jgi:hypothetical protein
MTTTTITVSLNTSADPPVTVNTPTLVITSTGEQTIQWVPGGSTSFTFTSLQVLTSPNPITVGPITGSLITAQDDNDTPGTFTYPYRIVVTANGVQYSTDRQGTTGDDPGDPRVENKDNE